MLFAMVHGTVVITLMIVKMSILDCFNGHGLV